jgi:ribosomal protein S18 acetylase RimI-like enzyme
MRIEICEAHTDEQFAIAHELFREYAQELEVDLCFQNFESELQHLPEMYGPPQGCLLLAREGGSTVGAVAVRPFRARLCEMKRLYVRPAARGKGLGRRLATEIVSKARALGYRGMVLDTLPSMIQARALYRELGFRETESYYRNPLEGVLFMEMDL